jgi:hypothetical protein
MHHKSTVSCHFNRIHDARVYISIIWCTFICMLHVVLVGTKKLQKNVRPKKNNEKSTAIVWKLLLEARVRPRTWEHSHYFSVVSLHPSLIITRSLALSVHHRFTFACVIYSYSSTLLSCILVDWFCSPWDLQCFHQDQELWCGLLSTFLW